MRKVLCLMASGYLSGLPGERVLSKERNGLRKRDQEDDDGKGMEIF